MKVEPLDEMSCGSVMIAKAPAATTKIAVPMAANGRSQPSRRPVRPENTPPGLKRSMTDQKAFRAESMKGAAQVAKRSAASEHQAEADANDISGRPESRALMRSSPSADGSTLSAAARSARRSTSS